jgi:hypothetical protein
LSGILEYSGFIETDKENKMNKLKAYFLGAKEFRSSYTTNCGEYDIEYDTAREFMHKITFRKWEA